MKLMICMRTDLNMRKGKMIAQAAHGVQAMLLDQLFENGHPTGRAKKIRPHLDNWLLNDYTKVCVGVESLAQMQAIAHKAAEAGIDSYMVQDLGKTDVPSLTYTCLILGPALEGDLDKFTGNLKLL